MKAAVLGPPASCQPLAGPNDPQLKSMVGARVGEMERMKWPYQTS
jgi:hypothetical protein